MTWKTPPDILNLQPHQVDIWRIHLDLGLDSVKSFESTLSADETQRASSFQFDKDRHHYIVAHFSLRDVLVGEHPCAWSRHSDTPGIVPENMDTNGCGWVVCGSS